MSFENYVDTNILQKIIVHSGRVIIYLRALASQLYQLFGNFLSSIFLGNNTQTLNDTYLERT